jgi:hypothetical protein
MRKILYFILFVIPSIIFAQTSQDISYQGIAIGSNGTQVINANITIKISIVDNTATGVVLYSETHSANTSNKGLFSVIIGKGTVVSGTFATINWGINSKFLKVEMDTTGSGTNYTVVSNNQMLSVPYALYSGKTASIAGNTNINDEIVGNRSSNFAFASNNGVVYVYNSVINAWSSQIGSVSNIGFGSTESTGIISSNQNFAFAGDNGVVYVYNAKLNSWSSQIGSLSASSCNFFQLIAGSNGNFLFASSNGVVYAYNAKLNSWSSQIGNLKCFSINRSISNIAKSNGNFCFASDNGVVYIYNSNLNSWSSQIGTPSGNANSYDPLPIVGSNY